VLICGDYLSPVEIPMLSASGSRDAYLATLERLRPYVQRADRVVPGHGSPVAGAQAAALLEEDMRYLNDWKLPAGRRNAAQRAIDQSNRERAR
jgi:glyoxylase-like metal-dependent hydrolase (beta-lactamase superfamily II)